LASFGHFDGSHFSTLAVAVSPALMLAISLSKKYFCFCAAHDASSARAAVRPSVEKIAVSGSPRS